MKQYKFTPYYLLALLVLIMSACSKMDDYKTKYMAGGSLTYPGIMDSVKFLSGRNRVMLTGLFTSDPKIVKYRVFWNSKQDSIEVPVHRSSGVDTVKLIIPNLPEGMMSFEIRTYDALNHMSIPIRTAANVYGDQYASGLTNRPIVKAEFQLDKTVKITWVDVNADAGISAIEFKYTNSDGVAKDTVVKSVDRTFVTSLPKPGTKISYRTIYLPTPTAIDAFYTNYQDQSLNDVTILYFKNYQQPFTSTAASGTGRWRIPTDWTVSASAKNHGGYGGWGSDNSTCLAIEAGWGAGAVTNGKIYQTMTLPAGNYTYSITLGPYGYSGPAYIVAAAGTTLPDAALVPTSSLGYSNLNSSTMSFVLTQTTQVSIGFVCNFGAGSGSAGEYFRILGTKFTSN